MSDTVCRSGLVEIEVQVVFIGDRKVLVDDGKRNAWLPLAKVDIGRIGPRQIATVSLPEWLAIEKEMV